MQKIDAVFTQRSDEDGLTAGEIMQLLAHLSLGTDEEVFPVIADGDNALVFGFIRSEAVRYALGDDAGEGSPYIEELLAVVNDMNLENADHLYDFAGIRTLMYY